jgi:hypothetical protein
LTVIDAMAKAAHDQRAHERTKELTGGMFRILSVSSRVREQPVSVEDVIVDDGEYNAKSPFYDIGEADRLKWMVVSHEGDCDVRMMSGAAPLLSLTRVTHHLVFLWKLPKLDQIFGVVFINAKISDYSDTPERHEDELLPVYFEYEKVEELEALCTPRPG